MGRVRSYAANGLIVLDEDGQAECPGSPSDCMSDFRCVTDGIGSQTLIAAGRDRSQVFAQRAVNLPLQHIKHNVTFEN